MECFRCFFPYPFDILRLACDYFAFQRVFLCVTHIVMRFSRISAVQFREVLKSNIYDLRKAK